VKLAVFVPQLPSSQSAGTELVAVSAEGLAIKFVAVAASADEALDS